MVTAFSESSDSGPGECLSAAWSMLSLPDIDLHKQSNFGPEMPFIACSHPKTVKNESPGRLVEKKQHHPNCEKEKPWQASIGTATQTVKNKSPGRLVEKSATNQMLHGCCPRRKQPTFYSTLSCICNLCSAV